MKITFVEPESIAEELGIKSGDELLEVNGHRVRDIIDYRFYESDTRICLKVASTGDVTIFDIEKDYGERVGIDFEEMSILSCGNDCVFCFVDQNPEGLREQLYFRDGDFRLSFMYGNYTTMTNAGPATLQRIIGQRLSPQYISVHVTDFETRKLLMGLKKDDFILDKIRLLHDNGIDMHTQIVLCPGLNDGEVLRTTIQDLYQFHRRIISLAIVPVGLTDHRFGLFELKKVDYDYANGLLAMIEPLQTRFRKEIGRRFVYPSDEFHIVAGRTIPPGSYYDGFPQTENGVGMVRQFITDFKKQSRRFPVRLRSKKRLTMVTAELPAGFVHEEIHPRLSRIDNLDVNIEVVPSSLFGRSVTVAGLLSGKCVTSALKGNDCGDLLLLPPDVVNVDGLLLDSMSLNDLENRLDVPVMVYDGSWADVFGVLTGSKTKKRSEAMLPILNTSYQPS
jgi:putative radical SAM enzyme (TIGR03279 family)